MSELEYKGELRNGSKGESVKFVQEWLCLHGSGVALDGDFGPATARAVSRFQQVSGLEVDGVVGRNTHAALVAPMATAVAVVEPGSTLGRTIAACARLHLAQHPREIGGQNRGPWVRLYMDGNEGADFPWCAGFVSTVLRQACEAHGIATPVKKTWSCDVLAGDAQEKGRFINGDELDIDRLRPGDIFLNRHSRNTNDWTHTGFVIEASEETIVTIEGNTNDDGHREGYEVCERVRQVTGRDYVSLI